MTLTPRSDIGSVGRVRVDVPPCLRSNMSIVHRVYAGKKSGEVWKKNAGEWTGRVEISTEEIPVSKSNMYGKGERLSSVFSPDGTLISASAAPHCGVLRRELTKLSCGYT